MRIRENAITSGDSVKEFKYSNYVLPVISAKSPLEFLDAMDDLYAIDYGEEPVR